MTSTLIAQPSTRTIRSHSGFSPLIALIALAGTGAFGCAGGPGVAGEEGFANEDPAQVSVVEAELRTGSGPTGLGYSCTNGTCTCDKSIENDCEDMSGVCRDADIDDLIRCIDGWLTTHCVCKTGLVAPKGGLPYLPPAGGVLQLKGI